MTINQKRRIKNNPNSKIKKVISSSKEFKLQGLPQKKGIIIKIFTMTPKKPNSAIRKVAKVQLTKRITSLNQKKTKNKTIIAYIPGENHKLTLHNLVLVRPGKTQDLPGVKFKIIKGALDYSK